MHVFFFLSRHLSILNVMHKILLMLLIRNIYNPPHSTAPWSIPAPFNLLLLVQSVHVSCAWMQTCVWPPWKMVSIVWLWQFELGPAGETTKQPLLKQQGWRCAAEIMGSLKTIRISPPVFFEGTCVFLSPLLSTPTTTVAETKESSAPRVSRGGEDEFPLSGSADMTTHFAAMHWCGFFINMAVKNAFWEGRHLWWKQKNMTYTEGIGSITNERVA